MISKKEEVKLEKEWYKNLRKILKKVFKDDIKVKDDEIAGLLEKITFKRLARKNYRFVIISGPSGVGRSTIGKALKKKGIPGIPHYTTRQPRSVSERKSGDYIYVSKKEFLSLKKKGEFLQAAETYGKWRGITKSEFNRLIRDKKKFYIDKSLWTTKKLLRKKELKKKSFLKIFIITPTFKVLLERHSKRSADEKKDSHKKTKTLTDKEIANRIKKGIKMLKGSIGIYDCYLSNDWYVRTAKKIYTYIKRK